MGDTVSPQVNTPNRVLSSIPDCELDGPAGAMIKVVSGTAFAPCRSLLVGSPGTATVIDFCGNTATDLPLQQGYNPLRVTKVTFGSAADIWALY